MMPAAGCDATLRTSPRIAGFEIEAPLRGGSARFTCMCRAPMAFGTQACRCAHPSRPAQARRRGGGCAGPLHCDGPAGPALRGCAGSSPVIAAAPGPASSHILRLDGGRHRACPSIRAISGAGAPPRARRPDHGDPAGSQTAFRSAAERLAPLRGVIPIAELAPDSRREMPRPTAASRPFLRTWVDEASGPGDPDRTGRRRTSAFGSAAVQPGASRRPKAMPGPRQSCSTPDPPEMVPRGAGPRA